MDVSPRSGQHLLTMRGVSKRFGGTDALSDARIDVGGGEIVALLGENGAGKSTLIKILAGVHSPDAGTVRYRGRDVVHGARRLPIAFIHQDLGLIEWMTVAENISLMLGFPRRFGLIDWGAARTRAERALDAVGAGIDPEVRVHDLTRTEKSLVAIARALAADAEVLVLDEPTASLPANEVARLFVALRRLRARGARARGGPVDQAEALRKAEHERDVFRHGHPLDQAKVLVDVRDRQVTHAVGHVPSVVAHSPRVGRVDAGEDLDERGFAGAILAQERHDLSRADIDARVTEGVRAAKSLRHAAHGHERLG